MSSLDDLYQPLPREEVIKAIDRQRPVRIPLVQARWWGEGLEEQYGKRLEELERYPEMVYPFCILAALLRTPLGDPRHANPADGLLPATRRGAPAA